MRMSGATSKRRGEIQGLGSRARLAGALLLIFSLIGGNTTPARAQLLDAWSLDSGIPFDRALPSTRLQAMGGMREAVPDENNEINLLDFGENLGGHFDDKPAGHLEAFTGPRSWFDRTQPSAPDQRYRSFPTGIQVNMIPGGKYAVGGSLDYSKGSGMRLVGPDLRRRFPLPIENLAVGSSDGLQIESELISPALTAHYVRHLGHFVAGIEGGISKEEEDRRVPGVYQIDHKSNAWSARASLAARLPQAVGPFQNVVLGANGRVAKANVDGRSQDALHHDEFSWERPGVGFQIHALGGVGKFVKGGVDFRYDSFEGQEIVNMNWSPQFNLNPTQTTIREERSSFEEGFRKSRLRTRWVLQDPGRSLAWGAGFEAGQRDFWQLSEKNVHSFVTSKVERVTDWRGTMGGSYFLARGRGLLAGEIAYGWEDRDNRVSAPASRVGASGFELGGGGEWSPALPVVLRSGYRLLKTDGDRDRERPESEFTTHRVAVGGGFRTSDARVLLDVGYSYDFVKSKDEDNGGPDPVEGQDRRIFTAQVRSVF